MEYGSLATIYVITTSKQETLNFKMKEGEEKKALELGLGVLVVELKGSMFFLRLLEDEEDAYSLNLFSKLDNLQLLNTLAQERLKALVLTT